MKQEGAFLLLKKRFPNQEVPITAAPEEGAVPVPITAAALEQEMAPEAEMTVRKRTPEGRPMILAITEPGILAAEPEEKGLKILTADRKSSRRKRFLSTKSGQSW